MKHRPDSGFAMLLVFLMASLLAITFYFALPRFAFESQRDKEQTLVDRGEQYKRSIQLYVRANKRWPAKVEDLENTNGKRFLRKRYVDPMTGKDEWRAVHVGPNGVLTDSLVKPLKKEGSTYSNNFITELGGVGAGPENSGAVNPALRKRPSDLTPGGEGGQQLAGSFPPNGPQPAQPNQPNLPPGVTLPGQTGQPGQNGPPNGTYPGPPVNSQTGGGGGISILGGVGGGPAYSSAPGANGNTPPPQQGALQGQNTGAPPTAAQLIQGILTTPRPGGAPAGVTGAALGSGVGGVQGGGIAGFASKFEGEGIKAYNGQSEYQKWEFVYDMSKDAMVTGGQQAIPQVAGPNTPPGQSPGPGIPGPVTPPVPVVH